MSTPDTAARAIAGRAVAAVLLGAAHRAVSRARRPAATGAHHPAAALGAAVAGLGPLLVIGHAGLTHDLRWRAPRSAAGQLLLVARVTSGALLEEVLWRGPLTYARAGRLRSAAAVTAGAAFVALHLRRDGLGRAPVHLVNTAAWSAAALLGRQVRWAALSHAAYNYVASCLHAQPAGPVIAR